MPDAVTNNGKQVVSDVSAAVETVLATVAVPAVKDAPVPVSEVPAPENVVAPNTPVEALNVSAVLFLG